ncbi:hypothetical protein G3I60_04640 [Streptomyces sp. SID13666]|uniref:hypothetical protein n=1 Tax=unclassified Streptomyces TaxID=2593676 RepID=UPI0013C1C9C6|nr:MULTISPECIES: hypothetical protein [unclassified Streptomyces]NEA53464.1 hypothetical protein [Streptomyces sp. SID13666]NEA69212.1 hypothetical protein [Streptomyces sp. SID13588]
MADGAPLGAIKGNRVTFGAVAFTAGHAAGGRTVLTATTTSCPAQAPPGPSPAAVGKPTSAPSAPAAKAGDDMARNGSGGSTTVWTAAGLAAALAVAATVFTATRSRTRPRRTARHGR